MEIIRFGRSTPGRRCYWNVASSHRGASTNYEEGLPLTLAIGSVANGSRTCIPIPYGPHAIA